jgi:hypothetical protein
MTRAVAAAMLLLVSPMADAQTGEPVEGLAVVGGPLCPKARELVLDDGRRYEIAPAAASAGATVQVRGGRVIASACGRAPGLIAERLIPATPPPRVRVTLTPDEAPRRLREVDALAQRHGAARFEIRLLGAGADDAAMRIALALLGTRPDLLERATLAAGEGAAGWRVMLATGERDALSVDDVDRILAGAR